MLNPAYPAPSPDLGVAIGLARAKIWVRPYACGPRERTVHESNRTELALPFSLVLINKLTK